MKHLTIEDCFKQGIPIIRNTLENEGFIKLRELNGFKCYSNGQYFVYCQQEGWHSRPNGFIHLHDYKPVKTNSNLLNYETTYLN